MSQRGFGRESHGRSRGRSRGRGREMGDYRKSESSGVGQAKCRRNLTEKSYLKLCDYSPTCTKGNSCPRAHNEEELALWQSTLRETIRKFSKHGILEICRDASGICEKGLKCRYAHSEEELEKWNEEMECRSSSGKVLEMCKNKDKECSYGEDCRYAHNAKELRAWINEHESNYLRSSKSKPEMCTFTVSPPPCKLGVKCPYAHFQTEKDELIQSLTDYDSSCPRPVPRKGKLLPFTLCKNEGIDRKNVEGKCIYGKSCPQAHSEEELQDWEQQRKESTTLQGPPQYETGCLSLLGSLEETQDTSTPDSTADDGTKSPSQLSFFDPFLVSLEDFQHHFSRHLSISFHSFILAAKKDLPTELGGYISHDRTRIDISTLEGQENASMFDLQYQLRFMQKNSASLATYVGMDESSFSDVTLNLLEVRNSLAHGLHQRESYEEKRELTVKYFRVAIALVEKMKGKVEMEKRDQCWSKLLKLECNLSEFLQFEVQKKAAEEALVKRSQQEVADKARETLAYIQTLIEAELKQGQNQEVTNFVAFSLAPRFKKLHS